MEKMKKVRGETTKSKPEKTDVLTEMFESFGIKVIEEGSQIPKTNKKKGVEVKL